MTLFVLRINSKTYISSCRSQSSIALIGSILLSGMLVNMDSSLHVEAVDSGWKYQCGFACQSLYTPGGPLPDYYEVNAGGCYTHCMKDFPTSQGFLYGTYTGSAAGPVCMCQLTFGSCIADATMCTYFQQAVSPGLLPNALVFNLPGAPITPAPTMPTTTTTTPTTVTTHITQATTTTTTTTTVTYDYGYNGYYNETAAGYQAW